ncbi:IclR family transcriptional regulator [Nocardioides sp. JQ2195]|uniref:IclR family transcriptional regulator n=1 Tax=Nocardioides sp. JQ2195 TaxID=2592334 RepID=UPI00143E9A15|nr:IclR family transcriptional regulator [Nocardioides sp. JQ2195]QIX25201.1 IclR family transcriptional regulator [Nocardioides sp. JQ2195]
MSTTRSEPATGTQALDRAAALIRTVVEADEPLSFVDLFEECGLPKSTTSRLLTALERTELLERTVDGSYVAGPLFWLYATRHDPWEELVRLARPTMEKVGKDSLETVNLAVPRGDRVVQVAQVDTAYMLGTRDWTEVEVPAHCSALGKVLYAHGVLDLPTGRLEQLTEHTVTDLAELRDHLDKARRRGFATTVDELEIGLTGLAVPVRGVDGAVIAALGISGPTQRLRSRLDDVGHTLIDRADQLSVLLRRRTRKETVA